MPFYYLNDSNQPVGPLDLLAIKKLEKAGLVAHDVLVCEAGREDWAPLSEMIEPEPQPASPRPPRTAPPPRTTRQPRPVFLRVDSPCRSLIQRHSLQSLLGHPQPPTPIGSHSHP